MIVDCAIIDDEPLAIEVLAGYLNQSEGIGRVACFDKASDALAYFAGHQVDVLFLDIEMPEMSGIELLERLDNPPVTIFTTAYRNYAFDGYELGVMDFLLKPISLPRFRQSLEKAREFLILRELNSQLDEEAPEKPVGSVFVKSGVNRIRLNFDEVTFIQGLKDYAIIHTAAQKIIIKGSIKAMEQIFPAPHFIRVHKSFIVAVHQIKRMERGRLLLDGNAIPVGRSYKEQVERVFPFL